MATSPTRSLLAAGLCLWVLLTTGCRSEADFVGLEDGDVADGVYANAFLGLTLPVPSPWEEIPPDALADAMPSGGLARGKGEAADPVALLLALQRPTERADPSIAAVTLGLAAEKLSFAPGIRSGRDYLFQLRKAMLANGFPERDLNAIEDLELGGSLFSTFEVPVRHGDAYLRQRYYAAVRKGCVLLITATFSSYTEGAMIRETLNAMTLEGDAATEE